MISYSSLDLPDIDGERLLDFDPEVTRSWGSEVFLGQ